MFSFLKKLIKGQDEAVPVKMARKKPIDDATKQKLESDDPEIRRQLATEKDLPPEVLYYLASDPDPSVRLTVAKNPETPPHAALILAEDQDFDIRMALGEQLAKNLANLPEDKKNQLYQLTLQALNSLAQDELTNIRAMLSNALKDVAYAPQDIINKLARDTEQLVAEPVLKCSMKLTDAELLAIISTQPLPWVLSAIAGRSSVSEKISDAIVETGDTEAEIVLLDNDGALISDETLEKLTEYAQALPGLQEALAKRQSMPGWLLQKLSIFIDRTLLKLLEERTDYDAKTRAAVVETVRRRLNFNEQVEQAGSPEAYVKTLVDRKTLDETSLNDAIATRETDFIYAALAHMAQIDVSIVKHIISADSPKGVVALAWKAGLSMRTAVKLQEVAQIQPGRMLLAREGIHYPLDQAELVWNLEFFGVPT